MSSSFSYWVSLIRWSVADDVSVDAGSERPRGLDLVVGGCAEAKDPSGGCDDLLIGKEVDTERRRQ